MRVLENRIFRAFLDFLARDRSFYIILATGLGLRVLALSLVGDDPLRNEAPGYMRMAAQLLHHENLDPYWPPAVPYYLFLVQEMFGESVLVARASILPFYLAFSAFLFFFIRRVATLRAANLAVLLFVFYPPYVRDSFNPSTEYPAAACVAGIVLFISMTGKKPAWTFAALAGILLGALILIRPSSLLVAAVVFICFLKRSKSVRVAVVPLAVSAIVVAAWLWKAHNLTGRFVMVNESNAQNFFWGNNPYTPLYLIWGEAPGQEILPEEYRSMLDQIQSLPPPARNRLYTRLALEHILSRPDLFLLRTLNRARTYFGFPVHHAEPLKKLLGNEARKWASAAITVLDVSFYWPIVVLAIGFLFSSELSRLASVERLALFGVAVAYALPYWFSVSQPRYNFPIVPLLAVPAVILFDSLVEKPAHEVFRPLLTSRRCRYAMVLLLAAFAYVQLEWIYMNYFFY